jgi:hypothetical protein
MSPSEQPTVAPDIAQRLASFLNTTPDEVRRQAAADRNALRSRITNNSNWQNTLQLNDGQLDTHLEDLGNNTQKGFFRKWLVDAPLEVVKAPFRLMKKHPIITGIALTALLTYLGLKGMESLHGVALDGGNTMLDRIGAGGAHLFGDIPLQPPVYPDNVGDLPIDPLP